MGFSLKVFGVVFVIFTVVFIVVIIIISSFVLNFKSLALVGIFSNTLVIVIVAFGFIVFVGVFVSFVMIYV